jgi:hypothetical protein
VQTLRAGSLEEQHAAKIALIDLAQLRTGYRRGSVPKEQAMHDLDSGDPPRPPPRRPIFQGLFSGVVESYRQRPFQVIPSTPRNTHVSSIQLIKSPPQTSRRNR